MEDKEFKAQGPLELDTGARGDNPKLPNGSRAIEMTVAEFTTRLSKFANSEVKRYLEDAFIAAIDKQEVCMRANKKRIENRSDQVDKRSFQEAVLANIECYSTIADAVRDLKIKPQFEKRLDSTLHRWAKEVWPSKPKVGRPKKIED